MQNNFQELLYLHLFTALSYKDFSSLITTTNKTPDFVEIYTTTKFKVIFAIHHRITAKFILRSYNVRKKNLFR